MLQIVSIPRFSLKRSIPLLYLWWLLQWEAFYMSATDPWEAATAEVQLQMILQSFC
jgi:hypothetical protein